MIQKIKITHQALKNRLERGECKFTYEKLDGTIREAKGTTRMEDIPEGSKPKGGTSGSSIAYYDLDANGWRSVAENQEVKVRYEDLDTDLIKEEIVLMVWAHESLEDKWISDFVGLIVGATPERADQLGIGEFKELVRVVRKYESDSAYASDLRNKWYKLISE